MLVLFLGFVLLSKSSSETTHNNNTQLKNQLQKSLSHVNEMLVDIEGKIENERKILSQIDYDLNYKEQPGFLDYEVTDIWWQTTPTPPHTQPKPIVTTPKYKYEGAKETRSIDIRAVNQQNKPSRNINKASSAKLDGDNPSITDIVSKWVNNADVGRTSGAQETSKITGFDWSMPTIPTISRTIAITTQPQTTLTSPIIPKETPSSSRGTPPGWPIETTPTSSTTDSIFIQDIKKLMELDQYGYFSTFLTKLMEMIAVKATQNVTPIIDAIEIYIGQLLVGQKLKSLGDSLQNSLRMLLAMMNALRPETLQQQAGVAHYVMKNKQALISDEMNAVLKYYDNLFTKEEGQELFKALELFDKYPDGGKNATAVSESILNAMLAPFMRVEGTRHHRKLLHSITQAIQEMYPNWRANSGRLPMGHTNNAGADQNNPIMPSRRSMNLKKIMRHFLFKHPNLFKKSNRHHKHSKKNKKHRIHIKQHRRPRHRKHEKHGHNYEQLLKRKAYTESSNEQVNEVDTSVSGAYYRQPSKTPNPKRNIKEVKQFKRQRTHKDPLYSKHRHEKARQKQQLLKMIAPTKYRKNVNTKYLKELALNFFRNKNSNLNYRRLMIESSEKEMMNRSDDSQNSLDNSMLHKIRETSSYSDEEDFLRTNLYDALRHGNRTFITFRSVNDNNNNNQTLRTLTDTSSGSDDEWIIKNNIYKVFEQ